MWAQVWDPIRTFMIEGKVRFVEGGCRRACVDGVIPGTGDGLVRLPPYVACSVARTHALIHASVQIMTSTSGCTRM
jgi:hypothetical protein